MSQGKTVKSHGIWTWVLSGNPDSTFLNVQNWMNHAGSSNVFVIAALERYLRFYVFNSESE